MQDTRYDYLRQINRALDHITSNLAGDLKLATVAEIAGFSSFHFHRIFRRAVGETFGNFVKRSRLERALYLMSHAPTRSLTDIALDCGFSSSSDFSRSFKAKYKVAPSQFDVQRFRESNRDDFESTMASFENGPVLTKLPPGENPDAFVAEIRHLPSRHVAYLRVHDPFRSDAVFRAYERLLAWAEKHGVADNQWLGYMWEDPEITRLEDCRYDVAVVIDQAEASGGGCFAGEIGKHCFPAMRVANVQIAGDIELEQRAIDWLYGTWLPQSGCRPDDQPAFEAWIGRPFAHGMEHFVLNCQLPVV